MVNTDEREVIGSNVTSATLKQIAARGEVMGQPDRGRNHLLFFHSNNAWIRAISSVNTLTKDQAIELSTGEKSINEITGDNTLAKNNVLIGGTQQANITTQSGGLGADKFSPVTVDKNNFITAKDSTRNSYNNSESLGYRPPPGITGLTVASKGTLGALREAQLKIKVWTLEDLEMVQALYLRPGFTVLLEWGHTIQLTQNKEVNITVETFNDFLKDNQPASKIQEELKRLREESSSNYDGMYGYVSNFSWEFTEDGGYDCTVKVISTGAVLESIEIITDPTNVLPSEDFSTTEGDDERKSVYHKLFAELEKNKQKTQTGKAVDSFVNNVVDFFT